MAVKAKSAETTSRPARIQTSCNGPMIKAGENRTTEDRRARVTSRLQASAPLAKTASSIRSLSRRTSSRRPTILKTPRTTSKRARIAQRKLRLLSSRPTRAITLRQTSITRRWSRGEICCHRNLLRKRNHKRRTRMHRLRSHWAMATRPSSGKMRTFPMWS